MVHDRFNDNAIFQYQHGAQLRLGEAWCVTLPDGMLNDLRGLLGEKNVRVV